MVLGAVTRVGAAQSSPQSPDSAVAAFLSTARQATVRYRDRAAALADGYHAVGPDFPTMGEHWVSFPLVARGGFDAERPQVLEYATVGGRPMLVGVAWAVPLSNGASLPDFQPVPHAWHFHSGTVADESFVASHAQIGHQMPEGPTLAVLHAWLWLDNPDGVFATDNWALPWARLGLTAPAGAPADAARMLSLATGGERYFELLAQVVARPDSAEAARIAAALARARTQAQQMAQSLQRAAGTVGAADAADLADRWQQLWAEIHASLGPKSRARLSAFSSH